MLSSDVRSYGRGGVELISIVQNGDVYELRFKYDPDLIALIKEVPGRRWNPDLKFWSVPKDKLGFFYNQIMGTQYEKQVKIQSLEELNVNKKVGFTDKSDIPNVDVSDVNFRVASGYKIYEHQKDTLRFYIHRRGRGVGNGFILADEPGCIDGCASIRIREDGKTWTRETTLKNAHRLFKNGVRFRVKCLVDDRFGYCYPKDIIDKGIRDVLTIKCGEYSLTCTPDHEIYTERGWVRADDLKAGDKVFANGTSEENCIMCGRNNDIITYPGSKFRGYCKKCMYRHLRRAGKMTDTKRIDSDGYVEIYGPTVRSTEFWESVSHNEGVYEHHYIWWLHTGHVVDTTKESIHHKNHIKTDNRFENLELLSLHDHQMRHIDASVSHLPQNQDIDYYYGHGNKKIWVKPHLVEVAEVSTSEPSHVYDIVMDSEEIHNFVANGIVVHNCGKTLSVMNVALYKRDYLRQSKHCLIIACVNSAKYNWVDDIEKHTNGEEHPYILGSRLRRNGTINYNAGGKAKVDDLVNGYMYGKEEYGPLPYFLVVNIEAFRTKEGRSWTFTNQVLKWCDEGKIDLIALDEIHKNTSPQSQQGKQILNLKKKCPNSVEWIPMTGTPITKKPTDVFLPLRLVDGHNTSSYYMWCQDFCVYGGFGGHEIIAYKNVSRLKNLLEPNMLRRRKEDILDLPPKIRMIEYVENTPTQEKLYNEICSDMIEHRESIVSSLNPLSQFLRLRQVNGSPELVDSSIPVDDKYLTKNAKMKRVVELVDDIVEQGEKVLIFSNWVEPLRTLHKVISKKYGTCCYVGSMSPDAREQHKKVFMTNPKYPVMIGTIGAMGTSHTLTVARNIIFLDQPWNPADQEQCEDRCHRPGQTQSLNIYTLITKGTIDERVNAILSKKEGIANYIVDNNLDLRSHPELFDVLLGIENK